MSQPVIAQKSPFKVELNASTKKWWCACGESQSQPFCDGSHKVKGIFSPIGFRVEETKTYYLCGCKQSSNAPFCDGTHKTLS